MDQSSIKFLSVSYVYDGLLYTNDERVPINSNDESPDDVLTDSIYDEIINDISDFLTKLPSDIVNTGVDLGKNALINFWNNLSGTSKTVIIIVIVILVLVFTFPLWYTLITKIIFRNDETSKQQSFRMFNNRALNKHAKKERKYENKMYLRQKKDSAIEYIRNRNDLIEDRNFLANRADIKYAHEQNKLESYERMNNARYDHERSKMDFYDKNNDKRYTHEQNKLESYERMNNARYSHENKRMKFFKKSNKERYAHEQNKLESYERMNNARYDYENKRMKFFKKFNKERYAHEEKMANNKASEFEKWRNFKTNKRNTPDWYKNYKDQEFDKLKKQNKNNSNESIEDLDDFFNKK